MTGIDAPGAAKRVKSPRNWWKIAFFVTLLAFEITREIAVIGAAEGGRPNSAENLFHSQGYVRAEGSWQRIDGGGSLVPSTVSIECRPEIEECTEAWARIMDEYVYAPQLDHFKAAFTADAITYENDVPDCVKYSVRIDLKLKKVFAVRERKEKPGNANCALLEAGRLEMQLGDGAEPGRDPMKGHFVPILRLIEALI